MATGLVCFALCENVIVDRSERFSLINIFDVLTVPGLEGILHCYIFISFYNDAGDHKFKIFGIKPDKIETELITREFKSDVNGKRIFVSPLDLTISTYEKIEFKAVLDDQILGSIFLDVKKVTKK